MYTPSIHAHKFDLPVEWEYENANHEVKRGSTVHSVTAVAKSKRVTKLRCACGEEIDR